MSFRILPFLPDAEALRWPLFTDLHAYTHVPRLSRSASQPSDQRASILFQLPKELRLQIWEHAMHSTNSPPPSPLFSGPRVERQEGRTTHKDIAYPTTLLRTSLFAILSICRQSRKEVLDLLTNECKNAKPQNLRLDVMAKGFIFYPTWTSLPPVIISRVPVNLDMTLRVFSPESFVSNDSWPRQPGSGFRSLLTLLNQFLHHGPGFTFSGLTSRIAIKTLTIRVVCLELYNKAMFAPAVLQLVRVCKSLAQRGDASEYISHISIIVQDSGDATMETLKRREWAYDVRCVRNENEIANWSASGLCLGPQVARFASEEGLVEAKKSFCEFVWYRSE
ncbi:hypothetical protein B0A48_15335 [Cryoendolithus antarcticus]|uniref:2EXR domain-containing protein n=1 Tax=Cryoendolithus antarcticus TaxID=1507870 RepID=A0A1V8SHW3_9PEZI|nr:hypothetical protein B0A48_15335 [Cryoendolithus antarcticus]